MESNSAHLAFLWFRGEPRFSSWQWLLFLEFDELVRLMYLWIVWCCHQSLAHCYLQQFWNNSDSLCSTVCDGGNFFSCTVWQAFIFNNYVYVSKAHRIVRIDSYMYKIYGCFASKCYRKHVITWWTKICLFSM